MMKKLIVDSNFVNSVIVIDEGMFMLNGHINQKSNLSETKSNKPLTDAPLPILKLNLFSLGIYE